MRDIRLASVDDAERAAYEADIERYMEAIASLDDDESRGLWIGAVLVAVVAVIALVVGWWARGAWG